MTEYKNYVKKKSVYIKGFLPDSTLDATKASLEGRDQVLNIQIRTLYKTFKGLISAVFDSTESAKNLQIPLGKIQRLTSANTVQRLDCKKREREKEKEGGGGNGKGGDREEKKKNRS